MVLGYKYDFLSNITYKINETTVKLLNLKENQGNFDGLTKSCSINFELNSVVSSSGAISAMLKNNKVPSNVKPVIFMKEYQQTWTPWEPSLEKNEFWLTLEELNKQKEFVVNLVNNTHPWCIAGLKKSITKDYRNPETGFACIHAWQRDNKIETSLRRDNKYGHRLCMRFTEKMRSVKNCYVRKLDRQKMKKKTRAGH